MKEKRLIEIPCDGIVRIPIMSGQDTVGEKIVDLSHFHTVDAMEVVHGEWIVLAEFFDGSICVQCSVCGEEYTYKKGRLEHINTEYAKYNYCPNCGTKMDGDGNG